METIEETISSQNTFVNHMFTFDDNVKNELMDVMQYAVLCIIPIVLLNNGLSQIFSNDNDDKTNLELLFEVVGEIGILFFGMFMIHRLVTYFPLYSGNKYGPYSLMNHVLVFLVILLSFQTNLGEKVQILSEKAKTYIFGEDKVVVQNQKGSQQQVTVTQPISKPTMPQVTQGPTQQPNYLNDHHNMSQGSMQTQNVALSTQNYSQDLAQQTSTSIHNLGNQMGGGMSSQPNFDAMYQEPMAANDGGAFGGFGSAF